MARRDALQAFHKLGGKTRREVRSLADTGQLHADPHVRDVSIAWARVVVETTLPITPGGPGAKGILGAVAAVLGGGSTPGTGKDGKSDNPGDRRSAIQILAAAGEPTPPA